MSYYYNYYVGYKSKDKVYPLGPYNSKGKLKDIISRSSSFASDLHYDFYLVAEEKVSDELRKEFSYEEGNECLAVKMLPIEDLPSESFIKKGYYLIEDVQQYEDPDNDNFEGFYDRVSSTVFASMAQNEIQFGRPERREDEWGEPYYPKCASDYMYYAYPDYNSKEFEAYMIRTVAYMLEGYNDIPEDSVLLALETEG